MFGDPLDEVLGIPSLEIKEIDGVVRVAELVSLATEELDTLQLDVDGATEVDPLELAVVGTGFDDMFEQTFTPGSSTHVPPVHLFALSIHVDDRGYRHTAPGPHDSESEHS